MQTSEEFNPSPSTSLRRWHPKLTPYRLLVLGTTIGIGTAKAVAAQEGDAGASTTLEWVSGVVIFLILHGMSTYDESPKDPPPPLRWLFNVDCMDYIWRFLSFLRIPRPSYSSEPEPTPRFKAHEMQRSRNATPVTLYRLFVCFTTAFFGLAKATITYFGYSGGANWVDWTLGVVVTEILFVLGMYENNTIRMWHAFFVPDHSTETQYGGAVIGLTLIFLFWIAMCFWMMYLISTNENSAFLSTEAAPVPLAGLTPLAVLREHLFAACFVLFMALVVAVSAFAGVANVAEVMSASKLPTWKEAADGMMMRRRRPAWMKAYEGLEPTGLAKRVMYHTVVLGTFLFGCLVFLAFWVVSVAANVDERYGLLQPQITIPKNAGEESERQAGQGRGYLAFFTATILFQLGGAGATAFLMWVVAWKVLLPPLRACRGGAVDWDRALLF